MLVMIAELWSKVLYSESYLLEKDVVKFDVGNVQITATMNKLCTFKFLFVCPF